VVDNKVYLEYTEEGTHQLVLWPRTSKFLLTQDDMHKRLTQQEESYNIFPEVDHIVPPGVEELVPDLNVKVWEGDYG
jgi:hypothetical protein